jgi:hypothetical protein
MAVTFLTLLHTTDRLVCILGDAIRVLSSIRCSAHSLLGIALRVLSSVSPDVIEGAEGPLSGSVRAPT